MKENSLFIGTAGWSIPKSQAASFPVTGSHLERYSQCLSGVEINSSFYRPHKPQTYAKWASSVPEKFGFAVKIPKQITHERRLQNADELLDRFLEEAAALGKKLGPLLVQLPPSLAFQQTEASHFFGVLRARFEGHVVCEPRHPTWFAPEAGRVLTDFRVARVVADPSIVPEAAKPGGWPGLVYYRLHGSPRVYYSNYPIGYLQTLARELARYVEQGVSVWCIFDNTAEFAATGNALEVLETIERGATRFVGTVASS